LFFLSLKKEQFTLETGEIFGIEPVHAHLSQEICYQGDHRENGIGMSIVIPGFQEIFFAGAQVK